MKSFFQIISILVLAASAACAPAGANPAENIQPGPQAWIDAPLDNSTLPQAEYQVISHANDEAGIAAFELSVNGKVLSTDPVSADQANKAMAHISQPWLPPAPGTYLLEVRAKNTAGVFGPSVSVTVTVGNRQAIAPTPSISPSATATIGVTPTTGPLTAIGLQNTNCHNGPGSKYDVSGTLAKDQAVAIDGISSDGSWVWVQHPNFKGNHCWLSIAFVKIQGSLTGLRVIAAPPLPSGPGPHPTATGVHQ